jgi:phage tail-like protein
VESGGNSVTAAFAQFSGVNMRVDTIQVRTGDDRRGVMDYIPALTTVENVTLSKGVIGDNEFLDWRLSAAPDAVSSPTGLNAYRSINVVAVNGKGERAVSWTLYNALPVSYALSGMDSASNTVLSETITFSITGFKRQTLLGAAPQR